MVMDNLNLKMRIKSVDQKSRELLLIKIINRIAWLGISSLYVLVVCMSFSCAASGEKGQEMTTKEPIKMISPDQTQLAPGMTKIEGIVVGMFKRSDHYNCVIKVEKVLGYGMATKPIGKGTEIAITIQNNEEELIKRLSGATVDQKYEFILEREQMVDNQYQWKAITVQKKNPEQ